MAVPQHLRGIKGDECQCGRRFSVRHCPVCGSSRLYTFSNEQWREKLDGSGQAERVRLTRCISCAHRFTEPEREFCDAPPISAALAAQKIRAIAEAESTGEHLRPDDKKLVDTLKEMGLTSTGVPDETRLRNTWFALKRAYIDSAEKEQTMSSFIEANLKAFCLPEHEVKQILKWQREEDIASVSNQQPIVEPQ